MVKKKWTTGTEIAGCGVRGFELFEFAKKGLQPYDADVGEPSSPPSVLDLKSKLLNLQQDLSSREKDLKIRTQHHQDLLEKGKAHPLVKGPPSQAQAIKSMALNKAADMLQSELEKTKDTITLLNGDIARLTQEITPLEEQGWKAYKPRSKEEKQAAISILLGAIYKTEDVRKYVHLGTASEIANVGVIPSFLFPVGNNQEASPLITSSDSSEQKDEHQETQEKPKRALTKAQLRKNSVRDEAAKIWGKNSSITIADMIFRDEINSRLDGKTYDPKYLRTWIQDLCPNHSPGRRAKKK